MMFDGLQFRMREVLLTIPRARLAMCIMGVLLLFVGYLLVPVETAGLIVRYAGYWFTFVVVTGLIAYLYQVRQSLISLVAGGSRRTVYWLLFSWVIGCGLLIAHASFAPKVMMDDVILESAARSMHESREVYITTYGRMIENQFSAFDGYVDKRPWLYPFTVSVMHDFSGYRVGNAYAVNVLCGFLFLGLLHLLGGVVAGLRGGLLLPALWLTVPLFIQNASGSGMDMINVFMIVAVLLCAIHYLKAPSRESEGMLSLSAVLLAYGRYESVIFCGFAFIVIVVGWLRHGRVLLSWGTIAAAPLLIGLLFQQKFFAANEALWELHSNVVEPFGIEHLATNFNRALNFFFHFGDEMGNSILVAILGLIAVLLLVVRIPKWIVCVPSAGPVKLSLGLMMCFLCGHLFIILCYHDGALDRLFASRFALPFYLMLTCAIVLCVGLLDRSVVVWRSVFGVTLLCLMGIALPNSAKGVFTHRNFVVRELQWLEHILETEMQPRALLVDQYGVYWSLRNISTLPQSIVSISDQRIVEEVKNGKFSEVLLVDRRETVIEDAQIQMLKSDFESKHFELELIAEASFKPFQVTQVYRVLNIEPEFRGDE